jgi:hypothetical protein
MCRWPRRLNPNISNQYIPVLYLRNFSGKGDQNFLLGGKDGENLRSDEQAEMTSDTLVEYRIPKHYLGNDLSRKRALYTGRHRSYNVTMRVKSNKKNNKRCPERLNMPLERRSWTPKARIALISASAMNDTIADSIGFLIRTCCNRKKVLKTTKTPIPVNSSKELIFISGSISPNITERNPTSIIFSIRWRSK